MPRSLKSRHAEAKRMAARRRIEFDLSPTHFDWLTQSPCCYCGAAPTVRPGGIDRLDSGVGTCGKDGQSVPVGVGQPTLRIDALTVGGTSR